MLLPLGYYQPISLPNPSPLNLLPFPSITSQNLTLRRRRRASVVVAAADTTALSRSAIERIAEKLRSLGYVEDDGRKKIPEETGSSSSSAGEIFVPLPTQLPKYRVGHTLDPSWSTPENPVPRPGSGNAIQRFHEMKDEVRKEKEEERKKKRMEKRERAPSLAELSLSPLELRRLTRLGIALKQKINVGKAGITEGIVTGIHERWRRSELVKIKCKELCRVNMKRTHDILERRTGGMVIWRAGSMMVMYRGADYKYPYFNIDDVSTNNATHDVSTDVLDGNETSSSGASGTESARINGGVSHPSLVKGVGWPNRVRFELPSETELIEEADRLLEGLGPRFTDWWGYNPPPVNADLLPAIVPGYRRPFRLLPYGVKPILTNDEMTTLKRLARPIRCHFVLSRNRKLQGLAAAIVKLWEKCEIAKIAVKRGAQNTNSQLMAEELKLLTGGVLLSRDREYITLYRGKDFLPAAVSSAIEERRKQIREKRREESNSPVVDVKKVTQSREPVQSVLKFSPVADAKELNQSKESAQPILEFSSEADVKELTQSRESTQPILEFSSEADVKGLTQSRESAQPILEFSSETDVKELTQSRESAQPILELSSEADVKELTQSRESAQPILEFSPVSDVEYESTNKDNKNDVPRKKALNSMEAAIKRTTYRLNAALEKKANAEKLLQLLDNEETLQQLDVDKEGITEEERYMLRRVGLRMKPFLLLGRRGVFDGTVENMHLHWKYRELVKIIAGRKSVGEVQQIARILERESGGILVAIERTSKGYAIIVYRGKNYVRPSSLRPDTLLNKRQAMKRSIEAQRRESLKLHVLKLNKNIEDLRLQLVKDQERNDIHLGESKDTMHSAHQELQQEFSIQDEVDTYESECQDRLPTEEITTVANLDLEDRSSAKDEEINDVQPRESNIGEELQQDFSIQSENKAEVELDTSEPVNRDRSPTEAIKLMPSLYSEERSCAKDLEINDFQPKESNIGEALQTDFSMQSVNKARVERLSGPQISSSNPNGTKKRLVFDTKPEVTVDPQESDAEHSSSENRYKGELSRNANLSNRERLFLRKQALKMKKQPQFAVGKSNIVTGVAKVIRAHFKRYPLAIVNVKGRAKGTSVREVVLMLEEATGGVLVSQEPSKVILYRGWGATHSNSKSTGDSETRENVRPPISPELISAIRLECGLPLNHTKEAELQ